VSRDTILICRVNPRTDILNILVDPETLEITAVLDVSARNPLL